MDFEFSFDNSRRIFYKYYSGNLSYTDFESSWLYIIKNELFPGEAKGILIDYRDTLVQFPIDEAYRISTFFNCNIQIFSNRKIAFVTATPEQIILPELIREFAFNYQSRPFSTIEAAEDWLIG
jgi:hypothetical protein